MTIRPAGAIVGRRAAAPGLALVRARCPRASIRRRADARPPTRGSAPARNPARSGSASSRTKRSTAWPRSFSGMPGPRSATLSLMTRPRLRRGPRFRGRRSPAPTSPRLPYLMALSTRLASACVTSSRLPRIGTAAATSMREGQALLVGERIVELAHAADDVGGVELGHLARWTGRTPRARSSAAR